jgi:hypothetical protein
MCIILNIGYLTYLFMETDRCKLTVRYTVLVCQVISCRSSNFSDQHTHTVIVYYFVFCVLEISFFMRNVHDLSMSFSFIAFALCIPLGCAPHTCVKFQSNISKNKNVMVDLRIRSSEQLLELQELQFPRQKCLK